MNYLKTYLKTIADRGNVDLAHSIEQTATEIGDRYIQDFNFCEHRIGLLFGNVQSGKTGQMFGIITKATDLGFPAFVLLTTDNIVLQQQTLERVQNDLSGYCICGENDSGLFIQNALMKPVIIVLKKNSRILRLWANVFASTGFMKGNPLFIVDDEADAASLNTLINRNKKSSINKYLDNIKNGASSSIYLQVTGTPQAILLQTQVSGWHPYFTYYFAPGSGYLGGDFFFPKEKPDCITFIENLKTPAHDVVLRHLAVSALVELGGGKVSNCLVHPSVRQASHDIFARDISKELQWCKEHIDDEFKAEFTAVYDGLAPVKYSKASVSDAFGKVKELLTSNAVKILIMNGKNAISSDQYSTGANIVIGGNTLGRGVTFPSLHTIYYTRTAKKPQADTMWQHSRMFGYDRDPGLMMVYIDEPLYKLFSDINATNNSLIAQVESGTDHIKVYYPNGLKPTRSNVLDERHVATISGGTNYYPFYPGNNTIAQLDAILAPFAEDEPVYQVSLRLMKEILLHITSEDDFRVASFISIIEMMLSEKPNAQGILIVRRNRDVAQGTGALLSPNDWALGDSIRHLLYLRCIRLLAEKAGADKSCGFPT